jgi:CIC family chloride channel protein
MAWHNDWFKQIHAILRPRQLAILEACLIGLISGLAAVVLKQSVGWLGGWRLTLATQYPAALVLPLMGAIGGWLAGWLIQHLAPDATGSGIPQTKMALAGLPTQLDGRLAGVKLLSTLLTLISGFSLGRQGPTVQIGAALAAQLSRWLPTSPEHRRQMIAAGAAAGLAAGFNAPIAGVLFVVEELLQDVSGLTLGTAILASFVGAVVARLLGGSTLPVSLELLNIHPQFSVNTIPLLLMLGGLAGGLGVVFIRAIVFSLRWNQQVLSLALPWRMSLVGVISGLLFALLPPYLRDNASLQEIGNTSGLSGSLLAIIFAMKFGLTVLAAGASAPGGLFAPSLVLGSSLGYLVSAVALSLQTWSSLPLGAEAGLDFTSTFALAGMGAFFSAVTRGPITAIVIVFEITGDFTLVLPLMIGSVTAYWVGEFAASGSVYQSLLALKGVQLQAQADLTSQLQQMTAADLMQRQVETLSGQMTLDAARQRFAQSHHRGFPVMLGGELVGIITQTDLAEATLQQQSGTLTIDKLMTNRPVTVQSYDTLSQVLYLLNRYKISRLPVVDRHKLVGIITRADIIRVESEQLSGEREQPLAHGEPSYVVYQTRGPETGLGRILVPIANPGTAEALFQIAAAIAQERHYELECLQVIAIAPHQSPAETAIPTDTSRQLVEKTSRLTQEWQIPVHTQIRVGHSIADAVLETLKERHIDLIVMGWSGLTHRPGFIFGSVVDTILRQARCSVIVVKFPTPQLRLAKPQFEHWLLPTAGGPHSQQAMQWLAGVIRLSQHPRITLCHVAQRQEKPTALAAFEPLMQDLRQRFQVPVTLLPICAPSVATAVLDLAANKQCDVIVLGATQTGLLQQAIQGNIPEAIARSSTCTVILVRGAAIIRE